MKFEEIELLAARKEPLPEHSRLEELHCYECMKDLYRGFYNKRLTEEEAKRRKQQIKQAFLKAQGTHTLYTASLAQHQEFLRLAGRYRPEILEALRSRAGKRETMELMIRCISVLCQDQVFEKTALRLLGESDEAKAKEKIL